MKTERSTPSGRSKLLPCPHPEHKPVHGVSGYTVLHLIPGEKKARCADCLFKYIQSRPARGAAEAARRIVASDLIECLFDVTPDAKWDSLKQGVAKDSYEGIKAILDLAQKQPIPMYLLCPKCGGRHIDEGEFATKPHHTHACQFCGLTWRPAVVPTVGVQFLPGFKNEEKPNGVPTGGRSG